jgi:D-beta-D-heptose 7-phosphate kinase/D-beta-D-heptose 1-phosphate adenosyltransferase
MGRAMRDQASSTRLAAALPRFERARVLVIGDLMLDEYIWGAVSRISPEAPVPVVQVRSESVRLGGAANVAANVRALGAEVSLLGVVGSDIAGERLVHELERIGIKGDTVLVDRGRATTIKTRVVAGSQHVVRFDREAVADLPASGVRALSERLRALLPGAAALVISDYGKGLMTGPLVKAVLPLARRHRVPVVVDPKLVLFRSYRRVAVITPNHHEAAAAAARPIRNEDDLVAVGKMLRTRLDADSLLMTRGDQGMSLFERDGTVTHIPAVAQEVYDVTGAGDTVVATVALGLAARLPVREAAALANQAAGVVVGKVGTATVSREELAQAILDGAGPARSRRANRPGARRG